METMYDSHNRSVIKKAKAGDLLEFPRGYYYSHWAVYIGNEEVVHLAGTDNDGINGNFNSGHAFTICGKSFNKAEVKKESIWNVILDSKIKINNDKDQKCDPRPAHEIVEEALLKLGEIGYNVLWKNCEHFAAYCRYGVHWSKQADNFLTAAVGVGALMMVGALVKEVFWGSGEKKQKG